MLGDVVVCIWSSLLQHIRLINYIKQVINAIKQFILDFADTLQIKYNIKNDRYLLPPPEILTCSGSDH